MNRLELSDLYSYIAMIFLVPGGAWFGTMIIHLVFALPELSVATSQPWLVLGLTSFILSIVFFITSFQVFCIEDEKTEEDNEDSEDEEDEAGDFDETVERKWELLANVTKEMGLLKASAMATRIDVKVQKLYDAKTTKAWRMDLPKIVGHIARYRHNGLLAPTVKLRKYLSDQASEADYCVACNAEDFECDSCRLAESTGYDCNDDDSVMDRFQDLVENEKPSLTQQPTVEPKSNEAIPITEKQTGFHCRYCGAVTPSDSKFCENCGANLEKTE
jgi:hypothetical protein